MKPMTSTLSGPFAHWYCRWAKHTADTLLAAALLLTLFPVAYVVVAVVVKLTSPGPVLTTETLRTLNLSTMHHEEHRLWRFRIAGGAFVAATHLDHWPRLLNILVGTTSFVVAPPDAAGTYHYLSTWFPLKHGVSGLR